MSEQRAGRGLRGLFGRPQPAPAAAPDGRYGFDYLPADSVYLDSACQTLRPQPVIDAMTEYYLQYNACGERVRYEWGRKVDERVEATREAVLRALDLSPRQHAVFALALIHYFDVPSLRFGKARIHSEQVAGKNGGFVSARAGADLEEHVLVIVRVSGQQMLLQVEFQLFAASLRVFELLAGHAAQVGIGILQHFLRRAFIVACLLELFKALHDGTEL